MTIEQYENMLNGQGMACANSGCKDNEKPLHIDHDHSCCPRKFALCGKCIRGILCSGCNQALGNLNDSAAKIAGLLDYLKPRQFDAGIAQGLL